MIHIRIAWSILMLTLGGASLLYARQAARGSPYPCLRLLWPFVALNMAVVALMAAGIYACQNVMGCELYECSPWPFILNGLIQLCLVGIAATHARFASACARGAPPPARVVIGFAVLTVLLLAAWTGVTFAFPGGPAWRRLRLVHETLFALVVAAGAAALLWLHWRAGRLAAAAAERRAGGTGNYGASATADGGGPAGAEWTDGGRQAAVAYARYHLVLYAVLAAALCLPADWRWAPASALALPASLFPFWWVPARFVRLVATPALAARSQPALAELFAKHEVSPREREVAELILQGKSNKEIEDALCISIHTVKNHVSRLYEKLGVHSRGQMASLIREHERRAAARARP